jgi:hypothetical protein
MGLFNSAGDQTLSIIIKAKDEASATFKAVQGNVEKMTGGFDNAVRASTKFAVGLAAVGTAAVAFGYKAVEAAAEAEKQMAEFGATLATMGPKGVAARERILAAAKAAVQLGFDDETAANSIAQLFQRTGDLDEALRLNGLAMDLSRAKSIDLSEANKMIALVMSGNARALKMYGIEIDDTLGPMEALGQLQEKVAGQAQGFASTFQGQMSVFKIEWQNFLEIVGAKLLPVLTAALRAIIPVVEKLMAWADNTAALVRWLEQHRTIMLLVAGAIMGALIPAFIALAAVILTTVIPAIVAAAIALAPFVIGGVIIAGIVAGVLWVIQHWDMIRQKAEEVWTAVATAITTAWQTITSAIGTYLTFIIGAIGMFLDWVFPNWDKTLQLVFTVWVKTWELILDYGRTALAAISAVWNEVWGAMRDFFVAIWESVKEAFSGVIGYIVGEIQRVIDLYNSMKALLSKPISIVKNAATTFVESAVNRGNKLLSFDKGGTVPGPEGSPVPIIAHGQETILRPGERGNSGGNTYSVVINNPVIRSREDANYLRMQIEEALRDVTRGHKLATI